MKTTHILAPTRSALRVRRVLFTNRHASAICAGLSPHPSTLQVEVCGLIERAGDMVHGLLCIVAHDKRIRRKTASCSSDTAPPGSICPAWTKMGVVYDEHLVFLLHLKQYQRTRSSPGRMPVTDHVADIAGAVRPDAGQTLLASLRTLRQEWIGTLRSRARSCQGNS